MLLFFNCSQIKNEMIILEELPKDISKNYTKNHKEALAYCIEHKFNTDYYFLLDYSIHPGKNRFFIYDFNLGKIINSQLVAHGSCDVFEENPNKDLIAKFSNQNESHCSSKGKYEVEDRAYSSWGINTKYWLNGLEKTNYNAKDRVIVLHSWEGVPDTEVFPQTIALSWGCPTVSNQFMRHLDSKIKATTNQSILLWIIE